MGINLKEILEKERNEYLEEFERVNQQIYRERKERGLYLVGQTKRNYTFLDLGKLTLTHYWFSRQGRSGGRKRADFVAPVLEYFKLDKHKNIDKRVKLYIKELAGKGKTAPDIQERLEERNVKVSTMFISLVLNDKDLWKEGNP